MADTKRVWKPNEKCDDCDQFGVAFIHWGPLTENIKKKHFVNCIKKRTEKYK